MQPVMQTSLRYPRAFLASQQPYIERLLEGFNVCLSPHRLPHNISARNLMDEELWMPIRALVKLPELDSLFMSEIMIPFILDALHQYSQDTMEVDLQREMIRPKWALQSSVFISKVDENASTEQVLALLDDLRKAISHGTNPYEYRNLTIAKQSANAWTIGFGSPSAAAYATMVLRTKRINGSMILPMACVYINPPRAWHILAGIVVMEIDPVQYGAPFIPNELVPYYSENRQHIDMLYWHTAPYHSAPSYQTVFNEPPYKVLQGFGQADSNCYDQRGVLQGGRETNSGPEVQTIGMFASSGEETKLNTEPFRYVAKRESDFHVTNSTRKNHPRDTRSHHESLKNSNLLQHKPRKHGHERLSHPMESKRRSSQLPYRAQIETGARGHNMSDSRSNFLNTRVPEIDAKVDKAVPIKDVPKKEEIGERVETTDATILDALSSDRNTEGPIKFPHPESDSLPSPSFLTSVCNLESSGVARQPQRSYAKIRITSHGIRAATPESHSDVRPFGNVRGTQPARMSQRGRSITDQRGLLKQQGQYPMGRQHSRRGFCNFHVEQRNNDDPRHPSHSRGRRHYHQRQIPKDIESNGRRQLRPSFPTRRIPRFGMSEDGDVQLYIPNQSTKNSDEWQVISYKKPLQRRRSWRSPAGSGSTGGELINRGDRTYGPSSSNQVL